MANLQFVVTAVFNNKEFLKGAKEIKSTFDDLNRANNSTLNTTSRQINEIQGQINSTFNKAEELQRRIEETQRSINKDSFKIQIEKANLDELQNELNLLGAQVGANIGEDILDAGKTLLSSRNPNKRSLPFTQNQIEDILRAVDPKNDINTTKILTALTELLFEFGRKKDAEFMIKTGLVPGMPIPVNKNLEELEKDLTDINNRIAELFGTINENVSERIQRQFPDFFAFLKKFQEVREKQQEIADLEINITGNETALAQEQAELDSLFQTVSQLLEQRDQLGDTFFPEIDLGIDEDAFNLDNLSVPKLKLDLDPEQQKQIEQQIENTTGKIDEQTSSFNALGVEVAMVGGGFELVTNSQSEFAQKQQETNQKLAEGKDQLEGFAEETENASVVLDSLGVFAADVAASINDTFADLIFNAFKGNFENIGELWSATLDSMLEALSQFAATAITNPIRIGIESVFNNLIPSGPIGVKDGEDPGITNLLGGGLGGGVATILSKIGLFAKDTIPLIGTIINAVIAVAATAISLIKGLFEKKPRLDIDLDQIRDDAGKRVGEIAKVADFLDDDLVNNIINVSVKRKAGLEGIGDSGIKKQIKDAIQTQIADIQDIINTLPADIASSLNELLLSTEVDTESLVKGDRLLEFDETRQENQQNIINLDGFRENEDEFRLAA